MYYETTRAFGPDKDGKMQEVKFQTRSDGAIIRRARLKPKRGKDYGRTDEN